MKKVICINNRFHPVYKTHSLNGAPEIGEKSTVLHEESCLCGCDQMVYFLEEYPLPLYDGKAVGWPADHFVDVELTAEESREYRESINEEFVKLFA